MTTLDVRCMTKGGGRGMKGGWKPPGLLRESTR